MITDIEKSPMLTVDLHTHSTVSDGVFSPEEIVCHALAKGAVALALTDHDTMAGIRIAAPLAAQVDIWLVPALEFNTDAAGVEMDILGYFWRLPEAKWFHELLESRQKERIRRAREIVDKLNGLGFEISYEQVRRIAKGIVARPHIAQVMVEKGYVQSQKEAYEKYIGFGKPAYAERDELHPVQAIQYVREAKGLAVLAHPGLLQQDHLLPDLIKAGLDGLEVYYPEHSTEQIEKYLSMAQDYQLVVTAGTDCHGPGREKQHPVASVGLPKHYFEVFRERLCIAWQDR